MPEVTLVAVLDADKEGIPAFRHRAHPDRRGAPPATSRAA